jgi:hypothetical protein
MSLRDQPSPVLATRLNRLPTLTFSRSLSLKNTLPKILYVLHASTGQSHIMYTLSSLQHSHSRHSCRSVFPSLWKWGLRVVWPVNSPTAALSLNLLIAELDRGYLISISICRQPIQVTHLAWCLSSSCFLTSFLQGNAKATFLHLKPIFRPTSPSLSPSTLLNESSWYDLVGIELYLYSVFGPSRSVIEGKLSFLGLSSSSTTTTPILTLLQWTIKKGTSCGKGWMMQTFSVGNFTDADTKDL